MPVVETKLRFWMDSHLITIAFLCRKMNVGYERVVQLRTRGVTRMYDAMAFAYALDCNVKDILEND